MTMPDAVTEAYELLGGTEDEDIDFVVATISSAKDAGLHGPEVARYLMHVVYQWLGRAQPMRLVS